MESVWSTRRGTTRSGQGRPWCFSDSVDLAPHTGSVGVARLHVRRVLRAWGLDELGDDAEQVVSEVTANAVEAHRREHLEMPVRVVLLAGLRTLLVIVRDGSAGEPAMGRPGEDDESGRGLFIVNALADQWDVKPLQGGGKAVRVFLRGKRQVRSEASASEDERNFHHDRVA